MALKLGELQVDIGADTTDLKKAGKEIDKTAGSMEKSFKRVGSAIAAALSFQAIKSTILLADSMNLLDSRIRALTKNAKGFREIREGIRGVAKETGGSIASITELAQRALIAKDALGATNEQIIEMVNNVQKLGVIGGGSQENLTRATVQLGQALSTPRVQAEELNSILEQMPLLAKEIEKNLGLLPGTLKQAVVAGEVLNTDIFQALIKSTDDINRRFKELPLTIDRAGGMIENAFAVAVQEIDNGLGITEAIAIMMKDLSEVIESDLVPGVDAIVDGFSDFLFMLDQVTGATQQAADDTFDLGQSWEMVKNALSFITQSIINLPANLKAITTVIAGEVSQAFISLDAIANKVWLSISNGFSDAMFSAINKVKAGFGDLVGSAQNLFGVLFTQLGASDIARSFFNAAETSKQVASDLASFNEEQLIIRQEQLQAEIDAITANTEVKLEASNIAIQADLDETDALKKQAAERRKTREKERKDARNRAAGIVKNAETEIKIEVKKTTVKKDLQLRQEQSFSNSLGVIFGMEKEAAIASATLGLTSAISKAFAQEGPLAFASIAAITAQFANLFSTISSVKGAGRQTGGNVSQGVLHPVNENGQPELLIQGSKQFLLSGQSGGQIVSANSMRSGGGGGMNVTVNNNAPDLVEVSEPFVTQNELVISINRAVTQAVEQVNSSLASGRGESSESLRQGFSLTRNI